MAYTAQQQALIDSATNRNNAAKLAWKDAVDFWNAHFVNLACYKDVKYDVYQAATWFTPNDSSCSQAGGGCTSADKQFCKQEISAVISKIGSIRAAYTELQAAQTNFDAVISNINQQIANDPQLVHDVAVAQAQSAGIKQKYIFWGIVVVVVAFSIFAYFKWFKK